jgi:hypothetical protein
MPSPPRARKPALGPRAPVLTEGDWQRLQPLLKNIDPKRQQAAYNRLVLGQTLVASGVAGGFSKQDVAMIVKAVLRWWERLHEVPEAPKPPPGWVALQVYVPPQRVDDVRRVVEALCGPLAHGDHSK